MLTGEKLEQEMDVAEGSTFAVVTTVGETRWTVSGTVGRAIDEVVPVDLEYEWFRTPTRNERGSMPLKLRVGDRSWRGTINVHGLWITASIHRKTGPPGAPAPTVSEATARLVQEREVVVFGKHLATLPPSERATAIVRWWAQNEAEYNLGPNATGIRFLKEMEGCGEDAVPILKDAMSSASAEARVGASAALNWLVPSSLPAFDELLNGLEDRDPRVREYCTLALCKFGHLAKPAIPKMIKNLDHPSALLRGRTVHALGYLGEVAKPSVPRLVEMLEDPGAFGAGWKPEGAVRAISRILFRQFRGSEDILEWWKESGKKSFAP